MRLSISARVSIACTSVIVMALALLAIGLSVGNKIHQADLRITILSDALGREDRLDQAFYVTSNPYRITINPVLKVDEASYDPAKIWPGQVGKRMGGDHPEAWFQCSGTMSRCTATSGIYSTC